MHNYKQINFLMWSSLSFPFNRTSEQLKGNQGCLPSNAAAKVVYVFNVHLKELNLLLVDETICLGVLLREQIASDSPNNHLQVMLTLPM